MDIKEIIRNIWNKKDAAIWLVFLRVIIGVEWFYAGLTKIIGGTFAAAMPYIFNDFIYGKGFGPGDPVLNPNTWMVNWLNAMTPSASLYGHLVQWGELLIGIALIIGVLTNISAIVGIFFNFLFFFAAGWSSPSTASVNWILWALSIILILSPGAKKLSVDGFISNWKPFMRRWLVDWFGFEKELSK
ncbi:MAG: DoxX family protein [Candidatus Heimdallarchaeaceae archaeon]